MNPSDPSKDRSNCIFALRQMRCRRAMPEGLQRLDIIDHADIIDVGI